MGTKEKYKHLYCTRETPCTTCGGTGKVYRPDLCAMDREQHDLFLEDPELKKEIAAEDLGGGWMKCHKCDGRGYQFDPVETWGQDVPKDAQNLGNIQ